MHGIGKMFPGVQALADVDFDVRRGEVHVLLGENGAGKSTLIKIISGVYPPDSGQMAIRGQPVSFENPGDAQRAGISVIYQEPNLIPNMTVAQNIHLGNEPQRGALLPSIDEDRLIQGTLELFDRLNMALDPYALVSELSLVEQQMVAIARALHLSADLIIMDEPTAMFSNREVAEMFSGIRSLRSQGMGIIYVTHRLEEAIQIGDRTTILRDGRKIATLNLNGVTQSDLIRLIVGRPVDDQVTRPSGPLGPEVLRLEQVSAPSGIHNVSLNLRAGEILGLTGLVGAGGTSILRAIFGADPISAGAILVNGQLVEIRSPQDAIAQGIGLLTEDRQGQGLVMEMNGQENITLSALDTIGAGLLIDHEAEANIVNHFAGRLNIHLRDLERKTLFLSGGTQQKLILSRWLASRCKVLLLDDPTRGIDVGARIELYHLINELSRRGLGLIVVSSNLAEILNLADRVAILRGGQIVATLPREELSEDTILTLASGGTPHE